MEENLKMAMLVLSCDKYSDLWDDFFNLRDKFWPDCPYKWYVVTESKDYVRNGVEVIKCGTFLNWAGRLRHAVNETDARYYSLFLEDYFINQKIDNNLVGSLLNLMITDNVSVINMSNVFDGIIAIKDKVFYKNHLIVIPKHHRYGLNTESAIWERGYLLEKLGTNDYSAWQFEIDRCNEAMSEQGLTGLLLCDDRKPFHISTEPVVIQGMFYPEAIKAFRKIGYNINIGSRKIMPFKQVTIYKLKVYFSKFKFGRSFFKWIGKNILGVSFFTR